MPPKETSMHLGGYYRLDNTRFSFWNNIDLRTGLFIKQLDFNFDKKYDINLWELAINERIFYRFNNVYKFSSDEILSILEHESKLFENILTKINPDFLIMEEPALHQEELLYRMCKKNGTKTLLLTQPNIARCAISENPRKVDLDIDLNTVQSSNRSFDDLLTYRKSINSFDKIN